MKALVLGGYGLIGAACLRGLSQAGLAVTGLGRDPRMARRVAPDADWIIRDLAALTVDEWRQLIADKDVVINASGALQNGARDTLAAIHETAIERLVEALEGTPTRLVQISAVGASRAAHLDFFRTKGNGDAIIQASSIDWVILRPALVVGRDAYGGTALLRAAAAVPFLSPRLFPDVDIQTVFLDDLIDAVVQAAKGDVPSRTLADIAEPEGRPLPETIAMIRRWLGFRRPVAILPIPRCIVSALAFVADRLGHLGWRSPLRSNALTALSEGIGGAPSAWQDAGGKRCRSLEETLAAIPATVQERWFSRLYLLFPLGLATLSLFWILSGLLGLIRHDEAKAVLTTRGVGDGLAAAFVLGGSIIDIALGLAILWRAWVRIACLGMVTVSTAYLIGGTIIAPDLWADPLGAFVKTLPATVLALFVAAIADER